MPFAAVSWQLDAEAFEQLVTELLRRDDDISLRQLLTQAVHDAGDLLRTDLTELRRLLDRLASFAGLAIHHQRVPWTQRVVATVERIYEFGFDKDDSPRNTVDATWLWLEIVTRVYALGALAVRSDAWSTVKLLADRRPDDDTFNYWGSWLRHATTMAFRAKIFDTIERAGLLARAHNVIRADGALHPDRPAEHKAILNSLCQFDVYAALVVIGERGDFNSGNFYTNFARYYSPRSAPAFDTIVSDDTVREILFDGDDELLANAIAHVSSTASKEGFMFDGWDGLNSPEVAGFIAENATAPAS